MLSKIFTDFQTRHLYANDASMYEEVPRGVSFPATTAECRALVGSANTEPFSITPRSAGTSLAGQSTGGGVIVDVSRNMTKILEINPVQGFARIQPGVIRDTLNREASRHKLKFGPDTATTNRCMLGGMIGNNSCGMFSIKHKTTRENILEIETVLSDGSSAIFKALDSDELERKKQLQNMEGHIYRSMLSLIEQHRNEILSAYPHADIIRRNTGYALDKLCAMQPFEADGRPFNLAELLCGSEGTLALTASAKVKLVPKDEHRIALTPHFDSIQSAMRATVEAVKHQPAAVELIDDVILNATKHNIEQRKNRFFLGGEPKCILIIQFEGNDAEALREKSKRLQQKFTDENYTKTTPMLAKPEEIDRVWSLRKAGLGLLMGLGSDKRTPSFCEDTAVRVQDLPEYVERFKNILKKYKTGCVFYGHASVGELHLRPMVNISTPRGREKMKRMAGEVAELVHHFKGSLSGEHGDGRARAPYIEKVLGKEMIPLLQKVKEIWDPNYIFNPGKIVQPKPMDQDLRVSSFSTQKRNVDSVFQWRKEGSFSQAVNLCNGAGVCRKLAQSGGTMCPSYMATKNEKDSTRGRANLFRQLFGGRQADAFASEELKDALDLCLSCKACKSECPANVDMARMKAEFMQGWHEKNGISAGDRFFGNATSFYPLANKFPKLSNRLIQTPVVKELLCQFFNIDKRRTLPKFAPQTFREWFKNKHTSSEHRLRGRTNTGVSSRIHKTANAGVRRKVGLLIDPFTNYHEPEIGKAAVKVLQALGFEVIIPEVTETGRPQLSKGMVKQAKRLARQNVTELHNLVSQNIPVVGLEPSEILSLRDEYLDLCPDAMLKKAELLAEHSYQFEEFFVQSLSDQPAKKELFNANHQTVYLHGHCHAKALVGNKPTMRALELSGYQPVDLETGCCGMAGSFGYEADHYNVSMDIGNLVLFPSVQQLENDDLICAPGFSCRHQIADGAGNKSYHPAELMARGLR